MIRRYSLLILFFLICSLSAYPHAKRRPEKKSGDAGKTIEKIQIVTIEKKLEKINALYRSSVKPIFQQKCMDCHSDQTKYPWYYRIPGLKQLLDKDIREGLEHLDISNDFPFGGHGSPQEDLEGIREVVENNSMPIFRYQVMHWKSRLTEEEKRTILNWVDRSEAILQFSP